MKNLNKNKCHPLVDVVIYQAEGENTLNCAKALLQTSPPPFNLFFGPVEDYTDLFSPRKLNRYLTPYLILIPSSFTFSAANWMDNLLPFLSKSKGYSLYFFNEDLTHIESAEKTDLWPQNRGILIHRSPANAISLNDINKSLSNFFSSKPAYLKNAWVDLAIATVNPANDVLWRTIESLYHTTAHPFRILITCGRRSLSANRNMGLVNATSDYVCLFDDDLVVREATWLAKLLETMQQSPEIAVVGPKIVGEKTGLIVRCGADDLARPIGAGQPSHHFTGVFEVHTMSSCMLMKRKVVPKFDLFFPGAIAFEDIDHAYRLRRKGGKIRCDARVEFIHLRPSSRNPIWTWNHLYYHLKYPRTLLGLGRIKGQYIE